MSDIVLGLLHLVFIFSQKFCKIDIILILHVKKLKFKEVK